MIKKYLDKNRNVFCVEHKCKLKYDKNTAGYPCLQCNIQDRLEYLRGEIEAERISYGELSELQSLAEYIDDGDMVLREWAGIPEFT